MREKQAATFFLYYLSIFAMQPVCFPGKLIALI